MTAGRKHGSLSPPLANLRQAHLSCRCANRRDQSECPRHDNLWLQIYAGTIRLAASRRRRFRRTQAKWEQLWLAGRLTPNQLQGGWSAALAITLHADSLAWRRRLAASPPAWYEDV